MTGLLGSSAAAQAITKSKLLLMLGSDFPWREFLDGNVKIIQIDTKPERLGRRVALHTGLTGDIGPTLNALLPLIIQKTTTKFLKTCTDDYASVLQTQQKHASDGGEKNAIKPEFVAATINRLATADAIFTADTGMCTVWAARYLHGSAGRTLMGSFSHGSMANAMPQAIGAALHSPQRQVIAFCGDGGLSMLMGDLMTIVNNHALGMVELEMQVAGIPDWQTKMVNPDFAALAQACGMRGYAVREPAELENQLQEAFSHQGPALIEVFTNPYVTVLPPHTSIGVLSRYVESQMKLAKMPGRLSDVVKSVKTAVQYIRDLR